jgi:hypothetical protein
MLAKGLADSALGNAQPLSYCLDTSAPARGALEVTPGGLEDELVEAQIRDRPSQVRVLALEVLEALGLGQRQAAWLLAPAVVAHFADAEGLDYLGDLLALTEQHLGLAQLADDLLAAVGLTWRDVPAFLIGRETYSQGRPISGAQVTSGRSSPS